MHESFEDDFYFYCVIVFYGYHEAAYLSAEWTSEVSVALVIDSGMFLNAFIVEGMIAAS